MRFLTKGLRAQIARIYCTNLLFYLNVLNIYSFIELGHMPYFVLDTLCTWCKVSLYSTLKVCSISRLLCNIQIHWSSSSGCRRKRSSSFSTTWRGVRRSTWQLKHSRSRVGGSTPSTWCGSNATRSPRRSTKSLRWSVYLVSWQYYKAWLSSLIHIK